MPRTKKINERPLPHHLFDAYEWITAAGKWDDALSDPEQYAKEAASNAKENGYSHITRSDLINAIEWYAENRRESRAALREPVPASALISARRTIANINELLAGVEEEAVKLDDTPMHRLGGEILSTAHNLRQRINRK